MAVLRYEQNEAGEPSTAPFHYRDGSVMHMTVPRYPSFEHPWTRPDATLEYSARCIGTRRFEGRLMGVRFWVPRHQNAKAMLPELRELQDRYGVPRGVDWKREKRLVGGDAAYEYRAEWIEYYEMRPDTWHARKAEARELKKKRDRRYRAAASAMRWMRRIEKRGQFEFARYEIRHNMTDVPLRVCDWFQEKEREANDPYTRPVRGPFGW